VSFWTNAQSAAVEQETGVGERFHDDTPAGWTPGLNGMDHLSPIAQAKLTEYVRKKLTTEERLVIMLRYCEELTASEIAAVLRIPESRVAQVHDDVVARVTRWLRLNADEVLPVA